MNRLISFIYAVCAIALLVWASGCGPILSAQSLPPPGRIAAFQENDGHYDLELSQGVAIAISCYNDGACQDVVVATGDENIADVAGASIGANALAAGIVDGGRSMRYPTATTSGFVIVGKNPGKTKVKVKTSKGGKTINVNVVAPPPSSAPAVVAQ
jgi:hypothetical protein